MTLGMTAATLVADLIICVLLAGNCGDSGRLDKGQMNLLKRYQTSLQLFDKPEVQQSALTFVLKTTQQNHACTNEAP